MKTSGDNYPQEVSQIPRERIINSQYQAMPPQTHNHGQESVPNIQEPIYNHGQEIVPNIQNTRSSVLNNDQLQNFKNEILQAVREEFDNRMTRNS